MAVITFGIDNVWVVIFEVWHVITEVVLEEEEAAMFA